LALQAGLPEGVFTILPGKGSVVGERFVTHPDVRKVCFTGSTAVGQGIMRKAADQLKRVTLELGGKSANIVFADADVEKAAASAPMSFLDNAGQDCCARTRILVQRSVFDAFMERFEAAIRAVRVGDPGDEATHMGPLISAGQRETVRGFVEGAAAMPVTRPRRRVPWRGARGRRLVVPAHGRAAHAAPHDRVWREEIFGPVVSVMAFDDEADAIAKANDTAYGLSAGRSGPATSVGRSAWRAASRPATCRSTATARCATRRPSAASRPAASAASSAPTRLMRSPRSRTSSSTQPEA
jgi:acyl-CoA reductase-like NAD-dependent aldehyde dehydrogenase